MHVLTVPSPPLEEHSIATKATTGLLPPVLTEPAISAPSLPWSSRERITSLSLNPLIAENHSMKLPGTWMMLLVASSFMLTLPRTSTLSRRHPFLFPWKLSRVMSSMNPLVLLD
ncbi:uncharacterized protein LOC110262394 [Arachis ipaensis]|uniref:uncharacterized protein LOC110262394 n=1 Tax=Arachis ipaensis TaxID=130454 RepID=UPI000A2B0E2C|nr:uncharacterized protein LOC110262394 [Arachis ipaensis]